MKKATILLTVLLALLFSQNVLAELSKDERILFECTIESSRDCVTRILDKGTNVNVKDTLYGNTPLHWAVRLGNYSIMRILLSYDADITLVNDDEETPLFHAVTTQKYYALRRLIEVGADVNVVNRHGTTPLHLVASRGHTDAAELLIEAGADLEAISPNGLTSLQLAIHHGPRAADTVRLLLDAGAKVNVLGQLAHANMIDILKKSDTNLL